MSTRIEVPSVVVLVGPSGAGKSTWARAHFQTNEVVSSDALRAAVGIDEHDQRAGDDAFAVLDQVVAARTRRGLTSVIDTTGLQDANRTRWIALANERGLPIYAVRFDTPAAECRRRNQAQDRPIPARALTSQIKRFEVVRDQLHGEGFTAVLAATDHVELVAPGMSATTTDASGPLSFGLQISTFDWPDGAESGRDRLAAVARVAEEVGFDSLWVMDHFRQIPQVGRAWDPMYEAYATLSYLAGVTERVTLGTLVTGVIYRNPAHLGKIVATLDVLSAGRAVCGLGLGWFTQEAKAYGWEMPPVAERYALLEDTLELLPLLWGPGTPSYEGRVLTVPEAMCYPRPLQDPVPVLVGGGGERRTLRLVARHADMCNLFGGPDEVRHKVAVLTDHCASEDRDPADIVVTHLSSVLVRADRDELATAIDDLRPSGESAAQFAARVNAGTVDDQVARMRNLAAAGVDHAIVAFADLEGPDAVARFASIIDAFRS